MVHDRASPFIPELEMIKPLRKPERVPTTPRNINLPRHSLSFEDEGLLRIGLDRISMDYKWMGNLSDSTTNRAHKERVVRLYRSWTGTLIFEVRYRPNSLETNLEMCEFAVETHKNVYKRLGPIEEEIASYQALVSMLLGTSRCLIGIEGPGVRTPFLHSPGHAVRGQPTTRRMMCPVRSVVKDQHFDITYITDYHIRLLRTGLGKANQPHRHMVTLSNSIANLDVGELVIRVYMASSGTLTYELRLRSSCTTGNKLFPRHYEVYEVAYDVEGHRDLGLESVLGLCKSAILEATAIIESQLAENEGLGIYKGADCIL